MKRQFKLSSKLGQMHIAPHKQSHKEKIITGLGKLRVGGTHEMIAKASGLRPDQVWKRISELVTDGKIFDTGLLKPLKSKVPGTVWQLKELPETTQEVVFTLPDEPKSKPPIIQQPFFQ